MEYQERFLRDPSERRNVTAAYLDPVPRCAKYRVSETRSKSTLSRTQYSTTARSTQTMPMKIDHDPSYAIGKIVCSRFPRGRQSARPPTLPSTPWPGYSWGAANAGWDRLQRAVSRGVRTRRFRSPPHEKKERLTLPNFPALLRQQFFKSRHLSTCADFSHETLAFARFDESLSICAGWLFEELDCILSIAPGYRSEGRVCQEVRFLRIFRVYRWAVVVQIAQLCRSTDLHSRSLSFTLLVESHFSWRIRCLSR